MTSSLTGLLNRRGFDGAMYVEMGKAAASGDPLTLVLFDLDRFKSVNDHLGHTSGDQLLQDVATAWRAELPSAQGSLSRYGGDEFALLLPRTSEIAAIAMADRLRAVAPTPSSAGITSWRHGDTVSLFVGRADIGLYRAKNTGRERTVVESAERPAIVEALRAAIEQRALTVAFQPIVDISGADAVAVAVEALVRWPDLYTPDISPEGLVRIAETNDLISGLGLLVLELACTQIQQLAATNCDRRLDLHVNVSGTELTDHSYVDLVLDTLTRTGWPAHRLVLEVTETDLAADSPAAARALHTLRQKGIRVAVDDFGSGYSSLTRIATLPCDILKVDRAIVADTTSAVPLLNAVTAIAAAFALEVIVEGVETSEQVDLLASHGIALGQGFYYARPQPVNDLHIPLANG